MFTQGRVVIYTAGNRWDLFLKTNKRMSVIVVISNSSATSACCGENAWILAVAGQRAESPFVMCKFSPGLTQAVSHVVVINI